MVVVPLFDCIFDDLNFCSELLLTDESMASAYPVTYVYVESLAIYTEKDIVLIHDHEQDIPSGSGQLTSTTSSSTAFRYLTGILRI